MVGRACEHALCVTLTRGVPPELRCEEAAPDGYGRGGGPRVAARSHHTSRMLSLASWGTTLMRAAAEASCWSGRP